MEGGVFCGVQIIRARFEIQNQHRGCVTDSGKTALCQVILGFKSILVNTHVCGVRKCKESGPEGPAFAKAIARQDGAAGALSCPHGGSLVTTHVEKESGVRGW